MIVAQLVEWLLLTPEIRSSNPDIGKLLSTNCTINGRKLKKEAGNGLFKKGACDYCYVFLCPLSENTLTFPATFG